MERREELFRIIESSGEDNKNVLKNLVGDVIFMEERLAELKQLPFIRVDEQNTQRQRATAAAKQYKEILQQYTSTIKILMTATGDSGDVSDSPLRLWVRGRMEPQ